jgi:hypothetical protein
MKERHLEEEELVLRKLCSPACLDDVHSEFACTIVIRKAVAIAAVQDPTELIPDDDECKDRLGASPCPFVCQFFVRTRRQGLPTAVTAYAFSRETRGKQGNTPRGCKLLTNLIICFFEPLPVASLPLFIGAAKPIGQHVVVRGYQDCHIVYKHSVRRRAINYVATRRHHSSGKKA